MRRRNRIAAPAASASVIDLAPAMQAKQARADERSRLVDEIETDELVIEHMALMTARLRERIALTRQALAHLDGGAVVGKAVRQ